MRIFGLGLGGHFSLAGAGPQWTFRGQTQEIGAVEDFEAPWTWWVVCGKLCAAANGMVGLGQMCSLLAFDPLGCSTVFDLEQ